MPGTRALGAVLDHLMATLDLSPAEIAQALGTSHRTVVRWLADETYPQHESRAKLDQLEALVRRLDATFQPPAAGVAWLRSPSGYFGGLLPLDALLRGRIDAVEAALEALDAGVFV